MAVGLGLAVGCRPPAAETPTTPVVRASEPTPTTDVEELHAFTKLYGYVRFFHPSDAAAAADWEWIAVEGARRVVQAEDQGQLVEVLRGVFEPIAPTVVIHREGTLAPAPAVSLEGEGPVVAWQHQGSGFGVTRSIYDSARTERGRVVTEGFRNWAPLTGSVDAAPLRGKTARLRARVRVKPRERSDSGGLWMRVDRPDGKRSRLEAMADRPVRSERWATYELEVPVDDDATRLTYGGMANGSGRVWFDDFELFVVDGDQQTSIAIENAGFEDAEGLEGWQGAMAGFSYDVVADEGGHAVQISRNTRVLSLALFDDRPPAGEVLDLELGAGLRVRLPVALPDEVAARPPAVVSDAIAELPGAEDPAVRAAAVVVAWNVLQHFYPYFDVIDEDWEAVLDQALHDLEDDDGAEDLERTLERLVSRLHDGHGRISAELPPKGRIPASMVRAGDEIVVTAAAAECGLVRGDRVLSIDGVAIEDALAEGATRASGSAHYVELLLLGRAGVTAARSPSKARLEIERGGQVQVIDVERGRGPAPRPFEREQIERLDDGVFYVDLDRAPWDAIASRLEEIAAAPGVVFDLRGYPNSNHQILAHLMTTPDVAKWMFVPRMIYPDQRRRLDWKEEGWGMSPAQPHIEGKVAFIAGPMTISYAESVMGYVQGYQLGEIVGSATAGANGNVNPFVVPGGFQIMYTGMKVTRMNGDPHHGIGVVPTVPAEPTREGIRDGRDEVLEVALEVVRGQG